MLTTEDWQNVESRFFNRDADGAENNRTMNLVNKDAENNQTMNLVNKDAATADRRLLEISEV